MLVVRQRVKFFTWYRTLPLVAVLIFGLISSVFSYAPSLVFQFLYPLDYETYIEDSAVRHGVDPYLVAAVIKNESNWDTDAESSQGARGLMQLMEETAQDMVDKGLVDGSKYSAQELDDPKTNIEFGSAYLSYLLTYFNNSSDHAIAAYNAGMGNVDNWSSVGDVLQNAITFPETQTYLIKVNNAYDRYKQIYPNAFQ